MMVRNTSAVLVSVIVLVGLFVFTEGSQIGLDFFSRNAKELICVARDGVPYSAVAWLYPIPNSTDELPHVETHFEPNLKSSYECDFSKEKFCNKLWKTERWHVRRVPLTAALTDERWEDFPLILTNEGSFDNELSLGPEFDVGFSVRASKDVEIRLCQSWNPSNYPCYLINVGDETNKVFLTKHRPIVKNATVVLGKYESDSFIISEMEWKTYNIKFNKNGTLSMTDLYTNKNLFSYTDSEKINASYLIVRSKSPALWKIHKNYFLYSNTSAVSKFGPPFQIDRTDYCFKFYVALCKKCYMVLYVNEDQKQHVIANINGTTSETWQLVHVNFETIKEYVQVYVKTFVFNDNPVNDKFWAVDKIKPCVVNEIKVSRLDVSGIKNSEKVWCQPLKHPIWRPIKQIIPENRELPSLNMTSTPTTITVSWNSMNLSHDEIHPYYVVQYIGHNICEDNVTDLERKQSMNYYVSTDSNSVIFAKLVPYTHYTLIFTDPVYGKSITQKPHTIPSDLPTPNELPKNILDDITDTEANIFWDVISCSNKYGPILYSVEVTNTSFYKIIYEPKCNIKNLTPFTKYSLVITTARKHEHLNNTNYSNRTIYTFQTRPGIAPPVRNLEAYSVDENSAELRFQLPLSTLGIPQFVYVKYCHPLLESNCKTEIHNLTACLLWNNLHCISVTNLQSNYEFNVSVALKNYNTPRNGAFKNVLVSTKERVPGKPENVSAHVVNCTDTQYYCHLNVSWQHPFKQNATITSFSIKMTEIVKFKNNTDVDGEVFGIVKVQNKQYRAFYSQILKYIPYSTRYNVSVQAANNKYSSEPSIISIETDHIGKHIDQSPELVLSTKTSLTFQIPPLDKRLNTATLYIIIQDYNKNESVSKELLDFVGAPNHRLCNEYGEAWLSNSVQLVSGKALNVTVGDGSNFNSTYINKPLTPNTTYCLTFIINNIYQNSQHMVVYHKKNLTTKNIEVLPQKEASSNVYLLFLLLFIPPIVWFAHRYVKRNGWPCRKQPDFDHVYEYVPNNSISNDIYETYDRLIHKQ